MENDKRGHNFMLCSALMLLFYAAYSILFFIAVSLSHFIQNTAPSEMVIKVVVLILIPVCLIQYSVFDLKRNGLSMTEGAVKFPIEYVREVGAFLKEHKKSEGSVLTTLDYLTYENSLVIPKGLEMGNVSCQRFFSDEKAKFYRVVNPSMLQQMINKKIKAPLESFCNLKIFNQINKLTPVNKILVNLPT